VVIHCVEGVEVDAGVGRHAASLVVVEKWVVVVVVHFGGAVVHSACVFLVLIVRGWFLTSGVPGIRLLYRFVVLVGAWRDVLVGVAAKMGKWKIALS
jgi:hypothetical protein